VPHERGKKVETTVGRVILSEIVPEELDFSAINRVMTKKSFKGLVG
jgi:DNA-directed RNA polymerase subunit beta'